MSDLDASDEAPPHATRYALLLDSDLFFAVKVAAMLKRIGFETTTVRRAPDWAQRVAEGRYSVALVNTAAPGAGWREAIAAARESGLPVIAYGSHVDVETQAEARAAGATRVIANSKLATDLPAIVEQTVRRAGGA